MKKLEMLKNHRLLSHVISHMHGKPLVIMEAELKPESMIFEYAEGNLYDGPIREMEIANREIYEYLENELFLKLVNSELVKRLNLLEYYLIKYNEIDGRITNFTLGYNDIEISIFTSHMAPMEMQSFSVSKNGKPGYISKVLLKALAM